MRKTRVKKLRKELENSIDNLKGEDKLRSSSLYKRLFRKVKKEYINDIR
jgi:hypothetical protein